MLTIANNGPDLAETNYWDSDHAAQGLCYLSGNAGVWRLLVPDLAESSLPEMRTARTVTIEPSISMAGCLDVVFEDGTHSPFALTIDKRQVDRAMTPGRCRLTVWTRLAGKVLDLACQVKG